MLAPASALDSAVFSSFVSSLEEALDEAELPWLEEPAAAEELLCEELPDVLDAVELLCEELVLSELLLWELLPDAEVLLLWELLDVLDDAVPLEDDEAGFSSLEELLLSAPEEDVLPDEPEEAEELLLVLLELEEPDELLDAAPLTEISTLLLVTVQSL